MFENNFESIFVFSSFDKLPSGLKFIGSAFHNDNLILGLNGLE